MSRVAPGVVLLLALGGAAAAQDTPGPGPRAERGRALRDELNEMVDAYLLMKVQDRLGLTDEQMLKVMPLIRKYHTERRELEHKRFRLLIEMRDDLASGSTKESQLLSLLRDLKSVEADLPAAARRNLEAIDAVLNPMQQVKYRLLEFEIDRHLREVRRRAWERRGAADPLGNTDPSDEFPPARPPRR